jgi:hypothetical protein
VGTGLAGAGYLCGFSYFTSSNPAIVLLMFWLFSLSMTSFSFFGSALVNSERTAVVVGFLLFVVGTFFQVIVGAGALYFYDPAISPIYRRVFFHYPPFNFAKIFIGIGFAIGTESIEGIVAGEDTFYFSWAELNAGEFPLSDNMLYLCFNFIEYFFVAWYLDYLMTADSGRPQPPYFCCLPSFWGCRFGRQKITSFEAIHALQPTSPHGDGNALLPPAIRVQGLDKIFRTGSCGRTSARDVHALKNVNLDVKDNRLFCMLVSRAHLCGCNACARRTAALLVF